VDEKSRSVQRGRRTFRGECHHSFSGLVHCGFSDLIGVEVVPDVGSVGFRKPVGDAPLRYRRPKTVRVADDPVCHETAVGTTRDAHPIGIDPRILCQAGVDEGHDIAVVHRAVLAPDVGEFGTFAIAPRGVAEDDRISAGSPVLHLVEEYGAVDCLGSTVDIENDRVLGDYGRIRRVS